MVVLILIVKSLIIGTAFKILKIQWNYKYKLHMNEAFCFNAATSLVVSDLSNSVKELLLRTLSKVLHEISICNSTGRSEVWDKFHEL